MINKEVLSKDKEHYVTDNLKLVDLVLGRLKVPPSFKEDLYSEGCLGLTVAAIRFDESKGNAFSSFAIPYIRGYILSELNRVNEGISLSSRAREYKIKFFKYKWENPEASDSLILEALRIPESYRDVVTSQAKVVSLEEVEEFGVIADPDCDDPSDIGIENLDSIITKSLGKLDESSCNIYKEYVNSVMSGEKITYEELGDKYGVSRQRVCQIILKVNERMRVLLKDYRNKS